MGFLPVQCDSGISLNCPVSASLFSAQQSKQSGRRTAPLPASGEPSPTWFSSGQPFLGLAQAHPFLVVGMDPRACCLLGTQALYTKLHPCTSLFFLSLIPSLSCFALCFSKPSELVWALIPQTWVVALFVHLAPSPPLPGRSAFQGRAHLSQPERRLWWHLLSSALPAAVLPPPFCD